MPPYGWYGGYGYDTRFSTCTVCPVGYFVQWDCNPGTPAKNGYDTACQPCTSGAIVQGEDGPTLGIPPGLVPSDNFHWMPSNYTNLNSGGTPQQPYGPKGNGGYPTKLCPWACNTGYTLQGSGTKDSPYKCISNTPSPPPPPPPSPAGPCSGSPKMLIRDTNKNLCLHVKGTSNPDGSFSITPGTPQPVITMPCAKSGSDLVANQQFIYTAYHEGNVTIANLGSMSFSTIVHAASGLALTAATRQECTKGTKLTLQVCRGISGPKTYYLWKSTSSTATPPLGSAQQLFTFPAVFSNPAPTGGLLYLPWCTSKCTLTDSKVYTGASVGLPVTMWPQTPTIQKNGGYSNANWAPYCPQ